ncbi:ABC transporter permease [Natronorarus salvus]|uniref:ABC transporter permease n=1 Tax=Natronorarus salvus TaxID=3117733 RepID=UPI002F26A824
MLETARFEGKRRVRGTAILAVGLSLYSAFIVWYFTVWEGAEIEDLFQEMPPAMIEAFGIAELGTIEGFLGGQIYTFLWLLGLGTYFAYTGAGLVATDIERGRMDLLAVFPISRAKLLTEKFIALLVPLLVLNVVVGIVIYVLVIAIGESIDPARLFMVHALSIPYFLVCAAIGMILSVVVDRASIAERGAIGLIFLLWLGESVVSGTGDYDWLAYLSPTHYYEPTPILIDGSYDPIHSLVLVGVFVVLFVAGIILFKRRDL